MRKVEYSEYKKVEGKSHFEPVVVGEAKFHQFGVDFEEFETGPGNFSTAILELEDGTILNHPVQLVKFLD